MRYIALVRPFPFALIFPIWMACSHVTPSVPPEAAADVPAHQPAPSEESPPQADAVRALARQLEQEDEQVRARAVKELTTHCDDGFAAACGYLAWAYGFGVGVPPDLERANALGARACALDWSSGCDLAARLAGERGDVGRAEALHERACELESVDGCHQVATRLEDSGRDDAALQLFRWSCDGGHGAACSAAAGLLFDSDPQSAVALYETACGLGDGHGCGRLGVAYWRGEHRIPDLLRAELLFRAACEELEDADGCAFLASLYAAHGTCGDTGRCRALSAAACRDGSAWGCAGLALDGTGGTTDPAARATLLALGCDGGAGYACHALSKEAMARNDQVEARRVLTLGCHARNAKSCTDLAVLLRMEKAPSAEDLQLAERLSVWACEKGVPAACRNLAVALQYDVDGPKDFVRALSLFQRACDGGHAQACNNVGYNVGHGIGTEVNHEAAVAAFRRSCDGGHGLGCSNLGSRHARGEGVAKDEVAATTLYRKGCDLGDAGGCVTLFRRVHAGLGTPVDKVFARTVARRGCELGDANACGLYGWSLADPAAGEVDVPRGIEHLVRSCRENARGSCINFFNVALRDTAASGWTREAVIAELDQNCTAGRMEACTMHGRLLLDRSQPTRDPAAALRSLQRACTAGDGEACGAAVVEHYLERKNLETTAFRELAERGCTLDHRLSCSILGWALLDPRHTRPEQVRGVKLLEQGCAEGNVPSCVTLASKVYKSGGVAPYPSRGRALMQKLCGEGSALACAWAGTYLERGDGGAKDLPAAEAAFRRACEGGDSFGCDRLKKISSR